MLHLVYANVGKPLAFKKALFRLSSELSDCGYKSSVGFNENFSVATLHLDTFKNTAELGYTLDMIHATLSLVALDIKGFNRSNLHPDIVRFCKNL